MFSVTPLPGPLGAEITGRDLREPVDDVTMGRLLEVFYDRRMIVIRGAVLTTAQYDRFARNFGTPHPHVLAHRRLADMPGMMALTNVADPAMPNDGFNGAAFWHTDQSYEAEPSSATMLHAVQVPRHGGQTFFANMVAAYDALPPAMKARIEGKTVIHLYGNRDADAPGELPAAGFLDETERANAPACRHPLARRHPVTGRKTLYAVAGSSRAIVGMADDDALALLGELKSFVTRPEFVYAHGHRVGDVTVWDTAATLHMAEVLKPATGPADTRFLYRVTVKGRPALA